MMGQKPKKLPWFWIIVMLLWILTMAQMANADPTTAPMSNIVRVYIDSTSSGQYATGFILEKGRVVTAKHVVDTAKKRLIIQYKNGTRETILKKKFNVSEFYDLASAKIKKDKIGKKLKLSNSGHFIGKKIYTVGFPGGFDMMWVSTGIVSSYITEAPSTDPNIMVWEKIFLSDVDAIKGCSGSPVFDYKDDLVGVVVGKYLCITAVVSAEAMKEFLDGN